MRSRPFPHSSPRCAGATSAAIQKNNSGLTRQLSSIASLAAIAIGLGVLLGGWGIDLPMPFLSGGGGH